MACRYPGAANLLELWENILTRRQQFRDMPDVRLPAAEYYDAISGIPDKTYGRRAAVLDGFDFDPRAHKIPKSTFQNTDIVHWLALSTALQAFDHAGLHGDAIPRDRTGVILGNTLTGEETRANTLRLRWPFVRKVFRKAAQAHGLSAENVQAFESTMEQLYKSVFPEITEDSLAGGLANTIAGRICNYLDLHGGGYIVDGACSSSLLSIATAADYLQHNKLDLVVAGGVDVSLDTFELIGFAKSTALSKDEMRVYDKRGSGFIPGEGCGMVLLKRLEDARRDGDRVFAVLKGWGVSSDGRGGITTPSPQGQARALIRAYQSAGYTPDTLDFIEGHGTGTAVGDRVELEGIANAVDALGKAADHSIGVTSFKSIVGHTKAAAGIGGFIKTVIALNRRVLPPIAGCQIPHNSFIDKARALYPIMDGQIREPHEQMRAGVSAMGFGGINCHVTLESGDPPAAEFISSIPERSLLASQQNTEVFPFSADDLPALTRIIHCTIRNTKGISTSELIDLAAGCAKVIQNQPWRAAVIAGSVDELTAKLEELEIRLQNESLQSGEIWRGEQIWFSYNADCAKVGFLFPGQGSQQVGMARALTRRFEWAQHFTGTADTEVAAVREELGFNGQTQALSDLFLTSLERDPGNIGGSARMTKLTLTENAQPAICTASWLWLERLKALGIKQEVVGGHSLGELTALAASGIYDPLSLVRFATLRGAAMSASADNNGSMAALSCDAKTAEALLEKLETGYCVIANRNSPNQTVISGEAEAVEMVLKLAGLQDIQGTMLPVSNGFHSRLVADAADQIRHSERISPFAKPAKCKIFSGMGGREINSDFDLKNHLADQIVSPVDFTSLLESMSKHCDWMIEVGPGRVLTKLAQSHDASSVQPCFPVESKAGQDADFNTVIAEAFVRGSKLNWSQLYSGRLVRLFIPTSHRKFYVNPCEREMTGIESQQTIELEQSHIQPLNISNIVDKIVTAPTLLIPAETVVSNPHQPSSNSAHSVLLGLICERTGFSENSIADDAHLIDDLNLDSIKIGSLLGDAALQLGVAGKIDTIQLAAANLKQIIETFDAALGTKPADSKVLAQLLDLVVEHTGFDHDSLKPEQKLLDDLNIDSIKAASLLGELLLQTQCQNRLQAGSLSNATLGEIATEIEAAIQQGIAVPTVSETIPAQKPTTARWVRAFCQTKIAEALNLSADPGLGLGANLLLIAPGGASAFADQFARQLSTPLFYDAPSADFNYSPSQLLILLDNSDDGMTADQVHQLAIFQRLYQQHPKLWQNLRTLVFIQQQINAKSGQLPAIRSFAASIYQERPEMEVVVLEADRQLSADFVAGQLAAELSNQPRYHAVEYDANGQRFMQRVKFVETQLCPPRHLAWSPCDVLLVTGGGKGITAECAMSFASETAAKLALIGRSPLPQSGENNELAITLQKLDSAGIDYRYYAADVSDYAALATVVASIRRDLGPITGILHGAGNNSPGKVIEVSAAKAEAEIATKLRGAENLFKIFAAAPLKLFAVFTSIIGVTGMRHNAWYAYSNETVARLLEQYGQTHPKTAVISYAFGVWDEVGMGVKLGTVQHLAKMGINAISVQDGVSQFMRWIKLTPPSPEVIVTASNYGLATWQPAQQEMPQPAVGRFLGTVRQAEPGIERISRVILDSRHDLYLNDHNYRGSLLLPTVMGLEAMAQNSLALISNPDLEIVRIEDIRLEQPIVVNPGRELILEIRTLAKERLSPEAALVVEASIHTEQTGWEQAHFSAKLIFGKRQTRHTGELGLPERGMLGIVPSTDLYGNVLFQGPLFQRISAINHLNRSGVSFTTEFRQQTLEKPEGFSEQLQAPLILGDPYFRDTLLQAAQLSVTPEICLPVRIDAIDLYANAGKTGHYRAKANILGREGSKICCEVLVVDENDHLIERISGYQIQILENRSDFPTPERLLTKPYNADQAIFQKKLDQAAGEFGLFAPAGVLRRFPALNSQNKDARHALEAPVFQTALNLAAARYAFDTESLQIQWLSSGKPVALRASKPYSRDSQDNDEAIGVSLSHDGEWVLCIAGNGSLGCDLVAKAVHTREQWRAMLNANLFELLQQLEQQGDSLDQAGTRLWSALEAAIKTFDSRDLTLEIDMRKQDRVIFLARNGQQTARILTLQNDLNNTEYVIAVTISAVLPAYQQETAAQTEVDHKLPDKQLPAVNASLNDRKLVVPASPAWSDWLSGNGDTGEFFGVKAELSAETNHRRIHFRFPMSFKDGANPDGSVYFVRLFEWMGRLREMALRPVLNQLTAEFSSGEYAWVTNQSWAKIHGPVLSGDVVEVTCQFLGRGGPDNSMVSVNFDWHRVGADGILQPLATSQIQMTWAKVISHGIVKPDAYPAFLDQFFNQFTHDSGQLDLGGSDRYKKAVKRLGSDHWQAASGPNYDEPLHRQSFSTSLNDANLVGNIYYSKYYELQGILRDGYFYQVIPEAYRKQLNIGGLRCIFTEVKHLRDAMPFDTIEGLMYLNAVHEKGIELRFEFFRVNAGKREKLAVGVHIAAWSLLSIDAVDSVLMALPEKLLKHLTDARKEFAVVS
jgi:acyl transferase domain-containing protein/NAD(P)-dependent dehydrogenase (short-subunit alcohol dehydrogenase family)/acyl-CoA thioesterase FadM